jgi:hypothetical protein
MARQDDFGFQFGDTGNSSIEVVDFKPQQYAVAIRLVLRITDRPMVVFDLKAVQLEDQRTIRDQTLIFRTAVRALTAEEALVPPATRFDVGHRDEGLRTHQNLRGPTPKLSEHLTNPGISVISPGNRLSKNSSCTKRTAFSRWAKSFARVDFPAAILPQKKINFAEVLMFCTPSRVSAALVSGQLQPGWLGRYVLTGLQPASSASSRHFQ